MTTFIAVVAFVIAGLSFSFAVYEATKPRPEWAWVGILVISGIVTILVGVSEWA